jgi:hypothetical protein
MFRVEWLESALNDLAAVWMMSAPAQREAITAASHAIDLQLSVNPQDRGESRPHGRRIDFFPPLGVTYKVEFLTQIVSIIHVWQFHQRS